MFKFLSSLTHRVKKTADHADARASAIKATVDSATDAIAFAPSVNGLEQATVQSPRVSGMPCDLSEALSVEKLFHQNSLEKMFQMIMSDDASLKAKVSAELEAERNRSGYSSESQKRIFFHHKKEAFVSALGAYENINNILDRNLKLLGEEHISAVSFSDVINLKPLVLSLIEEFPLDSEQMSLLEVEDEKTKVIGKIEKIAELKAKLGHENVMITDDHSVSSIDAYPLEAASISASVDASSSSFHGSGDSFSTVDLSDDESDKQRIDHDLQNECVALRSRVLFYTKIFVDNFNLDDVLGETEFYHFLMSTFGGGLHSSPVRQMEHSRVTASKEIQARLAARHVMALKKQTVILINLGDSSLDEGIEMCKRQISRCIEDPMMTGILVPLIKQKLDDEILRLELELAQKELPILEQEAQKEEETFLDSVHVLVGEVEEHLQKNIVRRLVELGLSGPNEPVGVERISSVAEAYFNKTTSDQGFDSELVGYSKKFQELQGLIAAFQIAVKNQRETFSFSQALKDDFKQLPSANHLIRGGFHRVINWLYRALNWMNSNWGRSKTQLLLDHVFNPSNDKKITHVTRSSNAFCTAHATWARKELEIEQLKNTLEQPGSIDAGAGAGAGAGDSFTLHS